MRAEPEEQTVTRMCARGVKQLLLVMVAGGLTLAGAVAAQATPTPSGGPEGTGLKPGEYSKQAPPLTGAEKRQSDAKAAVAMRYYQTAFTPRSGGGMRPASTCLPGDPCGTTPPTAKALRVAFQSQKTGYWCGPATMAMIVAYRGHGYSGTWYDQQAAAARALGTTTDGTNYGAMKPALNARVGQAFYANMPLPDSPSATQINYFKSQLVYDVNYGTGWPLAANEYAAKNHWLPNQSYYDGHHNPLIIAHWLTPIGYSSSGGVTHYQDPGWGTRAVSYYKETDYFVVAIGGRGYVF
jgi:hypothetical protein